MESILAGGTSRGEINCGAIASYVARVEIILHADLKKENLRLLDLDLDLLD